MNSKRTVVFASIMAIILLGSALPACTINKVADGYTAVLPAILQAGTRQKVSVSLLNGTAPATGRVTLALLKDGNEVARGSGRVSGTGTIDLDVPNVPEGDYTVRLSGSGFQDEAKVKVANSYLVFLETDKPIYKPGQTIHLRAVTLDPDLMPMSDAVTVEILDAKGIKVFRRAVNTDSYGMAALDLPLSDEPNLGVWKINASTPKNKTELDVRVEEYVLPKYEVKVDLPRDWFLVNEQIKGKVTAEYSFGKPVKGDLEIRATRYVGQWQLYSTVTVPLDGQAEFTIPAVGYVAGVPASGGQGNVQLEFSVAEKATGYTEKTTRLLTVTQSSLVLQVIPSASIFKPGLPFNFLLVAQTPAHQPVDAKVSTHITYFLKDFKQSGVVDKTVNTVKGKALVEITPPRDAVALMIESSAQGAATTQSIEAGYSPSGNFIHVEQTSDATAQVGQQVSFKVYSTREASNFYYEVVSRGKVVFSDFTGGNDISFAATPAMAPAAKLLVYQVLANAEIAADYIPFKVVAAYPQDVNVQFSAAEAKPGADVSINIQTEGRAKVGIVAVDRSVFILAENRLNLQQVFDDLERLFMQPQAELHEVSLFQSIETRGASETFRDAGVVVLSNKSIPQGKQYKNDRFGGPGGIFDGRGVLEAQGAVLPIPAPAATSAGQSLAEVQRIRQFFPETWLWQEVTTDANGKASVKVTVPDTITTWMLRAVALSKSQGLGVAETQLRAFQPFFLSVDLPYSAVRGEEFPLRVAVYNYLDTAQSVVVQVQPADWFDLLDSAQNTVAIGPNDIGSVQFKIRPKKLGVNGVQVTARSAQAADAVVKTVIIEPEGVARELVDNLVLSAGTKTLDASLPEGIVPGSGRAYVTLTSSYLTQTIDGLETLLQMPFGCGEQNMIVFAPDVFITRYLKESGQLKPEIMAKAEKLMLTGYQRELTYRRSDGSFSAFGQSDPQGSLWLTAFVLKSFAQAGGLIFIDSGVLDSAKAWIISHQNTDGSFDAVGFVHHQEMTGGVRGKTALTAYVAAALMQSAEKAGSAKAAKYLETKLDSIDDAYTMALTSYALELAGSSKAADAYAQLMKMAKEDENGLHWGDDIQPLEPPASQPKGLMMARPMPVARTADIEATGYATLALVKHGDRLNAGKAARWLVSKRNAYGGFGSTQDTVVGLEALTQYATGVRMDVDLTVTVDAGGNAREYKVNSDNFDVLQLVDVPTDAPVTLKVAGKGQAVGQLVRRFSAPEAEGKAQEALNIDVKYDTNQVSVNDVVNVSVDVAFRPPQPMEAGMVVVDISVPTGFAPVIESIDRAVKQEKKISRYDIAGRKVIFYVANMLPGDTVHFSFDVKALYPVKAKGVSSQAYSYYKPELSGETLGQDMVVVER